MKVYYKAVDLIQWVWKHTFGIEKSKTQIKRELEQGSVKLNNRKINVDDVFMFDKNEKCD
jgi:hypothetical protein